jgi:hypothetical protein
MVVSIDRSRAAIGCDGRRSQTGSGGKDSETDVEIAAG